MSLPSVFQVAASSCLVQVAIMMSVLIHWAEIVTQAYIGLSIPYISLWTVISSTITRSATLEIWRLWVLLFGLSVDFTNFPAFDLQI